MNANRNNAERLEESRDENPSAAAAVQERQPGDDGEQKPQKKYAPDPFGIASDNDVGARLLSSGLHFDKDLEKYAYRNIEMQFKEKPSDAILNQLREGGFGWKGEKKSWVKKVSKDTARQDRIDAEDLFHEVVSQLREAKGLGESKEKMPF